MEKFEVTGDRLREAQYINKSLSCLGDVMTALAQKSSHIPYQNRKLTLLLQDSLGLQCASFLTTSLFLYNIISFLISSPIRSCHIIRLFFFFKRIRFVF